MYKYKYIIICIYPCPFDPTSVLFSIHSPTDTIAEALLEYAWAESDKAGWAYKRKAFGKEDVQMPTAEFRIGLVEKALRGYEKARKEQGAKPVLSEEPCWWTLMEMIE